MYAKGQEGKWIFPLAFFMRSVLILSNQEENGRRGVLWLLAGKA